jgi:hypothetical protein
VGQIGAAGGGHCAVDGCLVLGRESARRSAIGKAAERDHIGDADIPGEFVHLRQIGKPPRTFGGAQCGEVGGAHANRALRRHDARHRAKQRRFACAIGADDRGQLSRCEAGADVGDEGGTLRLDAQRLDDQIVSHAHLHGRGAAR